MQCLQEKITIPGGPTVQMTRIANVEALIDQAQEVDDLPFWAELWPSALALASYLWQAEKLDLPQQKILELGCGLGLAGIVGALKGAKVTQSDFIPAALQLAAENSRQNGVETTQIQADWRSFPPLGTFSLIIGSDILYEPEVHRALQKVIDQHLSPAGQLLLTDPGRQGAQEFLQAFRDSWQIEQIKQPIHLDGKDYTIDLYCLRRNDAIHHLS
ncbi:methyltransferase domain-containing protein [Heliorestis acidaminivorans]|uniref:Methyltransferase domain-containing protein n=1 Tax=Heliorestis acidaminivorans TaxID=553427 RepID=A0A6I0F4T4_9FIRM|nr:methyltransferase domain-containing protein [Heliorestis acidaminivorans]KAB2953852.1 methyltransferase domain-containing protein [Heliorestis acidaminivorans]